MTGSLAITLLAALGTALVLGAVAHRLRMPPMVGYIAAGLLVGPFTPGYVADREEVQGLADIGVALLMFSIGIRFRLEELVEVGRLVLIGAPLQVAVTMTLGASVALLAGGTLVEALFLGAVVSICSSVVLVKVAGESTLETSAHGRLALSWSIAQDLITVLLVVVLSAIAVESDRPVVDALVATALAAAFVAAVLVVGSRVLPAVLARVAQLGSRELFVVAVAVVAIGTAAAAGLVGVSVALGAFVAGLALAESDLAASVLGEIVPLRELFATIFFVSVGVLLAPTAVVAGWPMVLALLAVLVLGKLLPIAAIVLAGGYRPQTALRTGALVAQGGEFSFVLATVGLQVGALDGGRFSEAMGAVVLSILLAAPVASLAARMGARLDRRYAAARTGAEESPAAGLRRHVVIAGYGVVGRTVARHVEGRGVPWVAVDNDYRLASAARAGGTPVIFGDAGTPSVLDFARIATASTFVLAIPDPLATRQAVLHARSRNERLHIAARAHSVAEEVELRRLGVARVITAERQVGNELVRDVLG
ncbi:MAG TPA: cation:proton antiporter, partial [Candidatus Limnocylindria bacterium]|nr:cation:proton antiporter [Candidatus Limnocylindria bacterium]